MWSEYIERKGELMKCAAIVLAVLILVGGSATAAVITSAVCVSDTIVVSVRLDTAVMRQLSTLNIEVTPIGSCESPWLLSPDPVALAQTSGFQTIEFRMPSPVQHQIYRYQTLFTNTAGEQVLGGDTGCSWFATYGHCGEALAARIVINDIGFGRQVVVCDGNCWFPLNTGMEDWSAVEAELQPYLNTGQVLTIYGEPGPASWPVCSMPGTPSFVVTGIAPLTDPNGCSATPVDRVTWGALKGRSGSRAVIAIDGNL